MLIITVKTTYSQKTTSPPDLHLISDITKVLSSKDIVKALGDSTRYYSLNFRIFIRRTKNGNKVEDIISNDTVAYRLFPNYKDLGSLNYDVLMKNKNSITLVIPFIYLNEKTRAEPLTDDRYFSLIYNSFRPDKLYEENLGKSFKKNIHDEVIIQIPIFCTPTLNH